AAAAPPETATAPAPAAQKAATAAPPLAMAAPAASALALSVAAPATAEPSLPAPLSSPEPPAAARPQLPPVAREETLGREGYRIFDRMRAAWSAQLTGGLSPAAASLAMHDWAMHLAAAPGKRMELA